MAAGVKLKIVYKTSKFEVKNEWGETMLVSWGALEKIVKNGEALLKKHKRDEKEEGY